MVIIIPVYDVLRQACLPEAGLPASGRLDFMTFKNEDGNFVIRGSLNLHQISYTLITLKTAF